MRKLFVLSAVVLGLVAIAPAATADRPIVISASGFTPRNITIDAGDTITWSNRDTRSHQVVVDRVCTVTVAPAGTATCAFPTAGRFDYREPAMNSGQWRGVITVRAAAGTVSIVARPQTVVYNAASTLSGVVSTRQANERVAVQSQACGTTTFSPVSTVTTTTGGAWTLAVRPLKTSVYQAQWRGSSARATVTVRPRVTLRKLTGGRFAVRVLAAQGFGGKVAVLQRYHVPTASWVRVRYVTLRVLGGTAPTVISGATVRARIAAGTRVRAVIGAAQVAPCYALGRSNVVRR